MNIRKAREKDVLGIVKIFLEGSSKKPYLQNWTRKKALAKIHQALKEHDLYVFVVEESVIGFSDSYISKKNKYAYLSEMWFKKNYQGKGYGTQLMKYVEDLYKKKGIKTLHVISHKKSDAFKFYRKKGYRDSGDYCFMEKKLK